MLSRMRLTMMVALALLLIASLLPACATTPVPVQLPDVTSSPDSYKNKVIELTGFVIEYQPASGDAYRTFQFSIGCGPDDTLNVHAAGYTAEAIAKAAALVRNAYETGKPLTVTGTLELYEPESPQAAPVPELTLRTIEYQGETINVARGPKTSPGFELGGWQIIPSIGINATITP
ncbi:MAG: hypothetical protein Kow0099_27840 [Candidatus Abyssubacteria bacterium]